MPAHVFTLMLALAASPAPAAASTASCPLAGVRIVEASNFTLPDDVHATHGRVRFLVDIGSDGRVRRTVLAESSGDAAVDAAATKALGEFRFAAPTHSCVAVSSAGSHVWELPAEALAPASSSPAA